MSFGIGKNKKSSYIKENNTTSFFLFRKKRSSIILKFLLSIFCNFLQNNPPNEIIIKMIKLLENNHTRSSVQNYIEIN